MEKIPEQKRNIFGLPKHNRYSALVNRYPKLPKNLDYESYVHYVESDIDFNPYYNSDEYKSRYAIDFTKKINKELIDRARDYRRSIFSWNEYAADQFPEEYAEESKKWREKHDSGEVVVIANNEEEKVHMPYYVNGVRLVTAEEACSRLLVVKQEVDTGFYNTNSLFSSLVANDIDKRTSESKSASDSEKVLDQEKLPELEPRIGTLSNREKLQQLVEIERRMRLGHVAITNAK